jgi:hypothetical protein
MPAIATPAEVASVAAAITAMRSRVTSTPSARASSSGSERRFTRQRSRTSGTSAIATSGSAKTRSRGRTPAKLPSSQNVIAGSWL